MSKQTSEEQLEVLIRNAKVHDVDIIERISKITTGQRNNPAWNLARKGRLTASNFGAVLKAKRVTPSLIKRLLGDYDLSGVRAIAWGVDNEDMAVKEFTKVTGLVSVQTGLWLHESGVLGASPDGLIGSDGVLEVKCPYTHKNDTIVDATEKTLLFHNLDYTKQTVVLKIMRDESWKSNLDILLDFYFYKLFPKIVEEEL